MCGTCLVAGEVSSAPALYSAGVAAVVTVAWGRAKHALAMRRGDELDAEGNDPDESDAEAHVAEPV